MDSSNTVQSEQRDMKDKHEKEKTYLLVRLQEIQAAYVRIASASKRERVRITALGHESGFRETLQRPTTGIRGRGKTSQ